MPAKKAHERSAEKILEFSEEAGAMAMQINQEYEQGELPFRGLHVEYLNIDMIRPDPVQPRRILPEDLHIHLHNQQMNPRQAIREFVERIKAHARSKGRPFGNPFELVTTPEDENAEAPSDLAPEEKTLRDLLHLAVTLHQDGQVNPLTVIQIQQGIMQHFIIETGERRYWAAWLSREYDPLERHNGNIPCIIIPPSKTSPFRQAKENTSRQGLNAIAMARQVALLLLHVHGYEIPYSPVTMDFYRQALSLDLRGKREFTDMVLSALGGITKSQLSRYKSVLVLCDEALEIADKNNIEESILRYVANLQSPEDQIELLQQVIQNNLNRKQVQAIVEKGCPGETNSDEDPIADLPREIVQMAKLILKPDSLRDTQSLIRAVVGMERDKHIAKARLATMRDLLDQALQEME